MSLNYENSYLAIAAVVDDSNFIDSVSYYFGKVQAHLTVTCPLHAAVAIADIDSALHCFQMSGCFASLTSSGAKTDVEPPVHSSLSCFHCLHY